MNDMNYVSGIINSPLVSRASRVMRYSSSRLTDPESLAIHTHEVLMIGVLLIDRIKEVSPEEVIDESLYMSKALSHDLEEISTGDVPRPLKYSSQEVRDSLQVIADSAARELFTDNFYDSKRWLNLWKNAKEGKEGHLLKLADLMTVLRKSIYEVDILSNLTMLDVVKNVAFYFKEILDKIDDFLSVYTEDSTKVYLRRVILESYRLAVECMDSHVKAPASVGIHQQEYD